MSTTTTTTNTPANNAPKPVNTANIPNFKKWTIIYPHYINSELTKDEGRRTAKDKSVKNPGIEEIARCCGAAGLSAVIESTKGYPSDFFQRGRVRVQMLNDQGAPIIPTIKNKTELMLFIAEKIKLVNPNRPENFNPISLLNLPQPAVKKDKEEKKKKKGKN
ncbi:signal recognition particle 19 kDa subunit [Heterostelium album PN500]|uniref:Signal recognition particle 19 kDa subunit n=1 Tax=Heterostelium pallidum (strain ATCC 26659 / Pp 5 / PN500) TaxID=670386 RepID=D3B7W9_HETP5|nr:signal recognition particle 19 kDa subunit [Heterostelium album PN500]EFA82862.1 signal recognition particle 19 kDa subunit [Heterostelium album PN500]|eukprot:XP_020434979.1 signal recognition particle 19 kDa subunit [Heterostelium album PN500]